MADSLEPLAQRLASLFREFGGAPQRAIAEMEALYHADLIFRDPIQTLEGRAAFVEMNLSLARKMAELSFEVHDVGVGPGVVFLAWTMRARPRLGPRLVIPGVTHASVVHGSIVEHVDHWDLLSSFAASVPGVGRVYRRVVHTLLG